MLIWFLKKSSGFRDNDFQTKSISGVGDAGSTGGVRNSRSRMDVHLLVEVVARVALGTRVQL